MPNFRMILLNRPHLRIALTLVIGAGLCLLASKPMIGQSDQPEETAVWELNPAENGQPHAPTTPPNDHARSAQVRPLPAHTDNESVSASSKLLPPPKWKPLNTGETRTVAGSSDDPQWTAVSHLLLVEKPGEPRQTMSAAETTPQRNFEPLPQPEKPVTQEVANTQAVMKSRSGSSTVETVQQSERKESLPSWTLAATSQQMPEVTPRRTHASSERKTEAALVIHESPITRAEPAASVPTEPAAGVASGTTAVPFKAAAAVPVRTAAVPVETAPAPPVETPPAEPTEVQAPWDTHPSPMEWGFPEPYAGPGVSQGLPARQPGSPLRFQEPVDPAEAESLPPSLQAARSPQPAPPSRGAELLPEFVEHASNNAGVIEIIVGQGRLVTLRQDVAIPGQPEPIVAIGDPTVLDLEVAGPRHLRLTGSRIGVTDLSVITPDRSNLSLEVRVVADLTYVEAILQQSFPTARVRMSQLREHVVVEGQARDSRQVAQIIDLIQTYLESVQTPTRVTGQGRATANVPRPQGVQSPQDTFASDPGIIAPATVEEAPPGLQAGIVPDTNQPDLQVTVPIPRIINLLTVPGPQQVMLKVQVAELNRTALRTFGNTFLFQDGQTAIATAPGSPGLPGGGGVGGMTDLLLGLLNPIGGQGTLFAVLNGGEINFFVDALRRNEVLKIMAEPTLVAMNGQEASFLAGGEFPVPVPQIAAAGVVSAGFQFKPFGVGLTFVPFIQENGVIRLAVAPEVSSLDFATPATVLPDTVTPVPAFSTRKTRTVVELREGQTLAISGLLQSELSGSTSRIPGLGDVPIVGPLFSGNSTRTQEKELVVLVTPYLVEGMDPEEVDALPGADVHEPTDCEFYLHGRIERRVCEPFRATSAWDDPFGCDHRRHLEASHVCGPYGYTP